jgi:hypothetical protein
VLGWFGNRLDYSATTIGDYVLATRCDIATMVVLMVCAVLAVWVIISIDGLQLRRLAQLEAPQAALHRVADSE